MNSIRYIWNIKEEKVSSEERYCSGCKKKVVFSDSLVRRHNANGKNIYQFAIYKCDNGHTWNKTEDKYHAVSTTYKTNFESKELNPYRKNIENEAKSVVGINLDEVDISKDIEISIISNSFRVRIDKLLSSRVQGLSRTDAEKMVIEGSILVNDQVVKTKYRVKNEDVIKIIAIG